MATFLLSHRHSAETRRRAKVIRGIERQPSYRYHTRELSDSIVRDRIVFQLLSRDGDRCYLCGERVPFYELDHVIARSRGGTSQLSNLALACKPCNSRKRDHVIAFTVPDRIPYFMAA